MGEMLITVYAASWQTWQPALNQSCKLTAPDRGRISPASVSHSTACVPSLWDHSGASPPAWPGGDWCTLLVIHCFRFWSPTCSSPSVWDFSSWDQQGHLEEKPYPGSPIIGEQIAELSSETTVICPFLSLRGPLHMDCRGLLPKGRHLSYPAMPPSAHLYTPPQLHSSPPLFFWYQQMERFRERWLWLTQHTSQLILEGCY